MRPYAVGVSSPTPAARRRRPALVVLDIVASVIVLSFALVFGLVMLGFVTQLVDIASTCGTDAGLQCNATLLAIATYGLLGVTVIVFCLGLGFGIVRTIQRRYTVPWTLGALLIMILAYYVSLIITNQAVIAA